MTQVNPTSSKPSIAAKNDSWGADTLDRVHSFLGRFVSYPSAEAHTAHVLWIAHTHIMEAWESTPRLAFLSPEPGSGKSRALEVTAVLVPHPVEAVNVTAAYLFRKVGSAGDRPTVLFDEIDTVFGPKARDNEDIRAMLNAGHRRAGTAGRCAMHGKQIVPEELPAYCAVALAGLGSLPDTILSRSVVIRMRKRSLNERIEPFRHRVNGPEGVDIQSQLAAWAADIEAAMFSTYPEMPADIVDRDADVWEAMIALADAAGGDWPERARVTAVTLVTASREKTLTLGVQLLQDLKTVFGDHDQLPTELILAELSALEESPWGELRGKPLDARGLARRLRPYDVKPGTIRFQDSTMKGYKRLDLLDPWARYLSRPVEM